MTDGELTLDYQEGFRDGIRSVFQYIMQTQFNLTYSPEFITWMGERMEEENRLFNEMEESA